jgi:hypothetical protein
VDDADINERTTAARQVRQLKVDDTALDKDIMNVMIASRVFRGGDNVLS